MEPADRPLRAIPDFPPSAWPRPANFQPATAPQCGYGLSLGWNHWETAVFGNSLPAVSGMGANFSGLAPISAVQAHKGDKRRKRSRLAPNEARVPQPLRGIPARQTHANAYWCCQMRTARVQTALKPIKTLLEFPVPKRLRAPREAPSRCSGTPTLAPIVNTPSRFRALRRAIPAFPAARRVRFLGGAGPALAAPRAAPEAQKKRRPGGRRSLQTGAC